MALSELAHAERAAQRGDLWAASDHLREVLGAGESIGDGWATAARLGERIGDTYAAVAAARRYYDETPHTAATAYFLAAILTEAGMAAQAVDILAPVAEGLPPDERFRYTRMLMFAGRLDEAQARARALLKEHPKSSTLWERIAQTKRFKLGDPDIDSMRGVFDHWPESKPALRGPIAGALAKAFVDIGDDAAANICLEARAAANRARFPYDPSLLEDAVRDVVRWCDAAPADAPPGPSQGGDRAIFILGPARSGTTLLDQVFSRHPQIKGGGEKRHFWLASSVLGDCTSAHVASYLDRPQPAGADPWSEIGRRYLALADECFGKGARFTDKLLSNHFRVRAIRQALPGSRMLYLKRSPLDVAWSCWRAQFDSESAWSRTQETTAHYVVAHRRIMNAWKSRYGELIADVSYERLVRAPDEEIPRVLAACGLTDDPATRHPHLSERAVTTLSFMEVRAPIHVQSVGMASAFPRSTRKLREALERHGAEME